MKLKDVSFWCVVLVIIVGMTFQHILSSGLVEGNVNMDSMDGVEINLVIETLPDVEKLNDQIKHLEGQVESLGNDLKNSRRDINLSEEEASAPVDDLVLNDGDYDIVEPEEEIIIPIDNNDYVYDITTCGKMGKDPPTKEECKEAPPVSEGPEASVYSYDGRGIHQWIVPKTGSYIIEGAGASGGTVNGDITFQHDVEMKPGKGAVIRGIFYLKKDDKYNIIIGQKGTPPKNIRSNPWNGGAGAGGGTFMWKDENIKNKPLLVAGGGGGQGTAGHKISGYGGNGSLEENGTMGPLIKEDDDIPDPTNLVDNFGKDGDGGGDPTFPSKKSKGWKDILIKENMNGLSNIFESESGFGGGGIMQSHAGGGGGGYSGGGSMRYGFSQSNTMGGGGGGSFFDEDGFKREDSDKLDYNDEDGYLKIKFIKEYFFVEGNKVKCSEHGGYEPSDIQECEEASKVLGFEWKKGPRKNGWNNQNCKSEYSKCIWRDDGDITEISECGNKLADKGLIYNEKCKGMEGYGTNGIDNIYKTVCVFP